MVSKISGPEIITCGGIIETSQFNSWELIDPINEKDKRKINSFFMHSLI
jgi:hypothetical protein